MNSLAYFGRAAAPPPHSYGQYYGFGLLKKRKRARVAKKTHIGYRKVRTVVINGRKRALYRRVRCAGRKPKNAARYRKFKRINGVTPRTLWFVESDHGSLSTRCIRITRCCTFRSTTTTRL